MDILDSGSLKIGDCPHFLPSPVRITNFILACGWTPFDIDGELSGEVPIPCD